MECRMVRNIHTVYGARHRDVTTYVQVSDDIAWNISGSNVDRCGVGVGWADIDIATSAGSRCLPSL